MGSLVMDKLKIDPALTGTIISVLSTCLI